MPRYSIGLDFGTESLRATVVDATTGAVAAQTVRDYPHGVISRHLPLDMTGGSTVDLPAGYALQHPQDWLTASGDAGRGAVASANVSPGDVTVVDVSFAGGTILPAFADGSPVCLFERFKSVPLAWPKLANHRAAKTAERISAVAHERNERWPENDSFFPKLLETIEEEPGVYDIADVWMEAGDWYVWQLTTGPFPDCSVDRLARLNVPDAANDPPSIEFLAAVHPKLADAVRTKLLGTPTRPGERAGALTPAAAKLLGLNPGTPVSAAVLRGDAAATGTHR